MQAWTEYVQHKQRKAARTLLANTHFHSTLLASVLLQWRLNIVDDRHQSLTAAKALAFWTQGNLVRSLQLSGQLGVTVVPLWHLMRYIGDIVSREQAWTNVPSQLANMQVQWSCMDLSNQKKTVMI
jgi:hypothetical protein